MSESASEARLPEGWSLHHEAEGIVHYIKRIPYQDAPLRAFGSTKEVALAEVDRLEALFGKPAAEDAPAAEEAAPETPAA